MLLDDLLKDAENPTGVCVSVMMIWLMAADGTVTEDELEFLREKCHGYDGKDIVTLMEIIEEDPPEQVVNACSLVRDELADVDRKSLLGLFLDGALADGFLNLPERYSLLFFVDLLHLDTGTLDRLFRDATGRSLGPLGDPSEKSWWNNPGERQK